ncbi:unnamed protein product [Brassica rapa subsp. trilocularis]
MDVGEDPDRRKAGRRKRTGVKQSHRLSSQSLCERYVRENREREERESPIAPT